MYVHVNVRYFSHLQDSDSVMASTPSCDADQGHEEIELSHVGRANTGVSNRGQQACESLTNNELQPPVVRAGWKQHSRFLLGIAILSSTCITLGASVAGWYFGQVPPFTAGRGYFSVITT